MELHCLGECPEKQIVETFLKFYLMQLAGWTERNVNKNYTQLTLRFKYNKMNF